MCCCRRAAAIAMHRNRAWSRSRSTVSVPHPRPRAYTHRHSCIATHECTSVIVLSLWMLRGRRVGLPVAALGAQRRVYSVAGRLGFYAEWLLHRPQTHHYVSEGCRFCFVCLWLEGSASRGCVSIGQLRPWRSHACSMLLLLWHSLHHWYAWYCCDSELCHAGRNILPPPRTQYNFNSVTVLLYSTACAYRLAKRVHDDQAGSGCAFGARGDWATFCGVNTSSLHNACQAQANVCSLTAHKAALLSSSCHK